MMQNPPKHPPHSIEAEMSVLGGLMLDNRRFSDVAELITEADFYLPGHATIWKGISEMLTKGRGCDFITLTEVLRHRGWLEEAGGMSFLGSLVNDCPSASNVLSYAAIVRERAVMRRLISAGQEIAEMGFRPDGRPVSELIELAQNKTAKIDIEPDTGAAGTLDQLFPIWEADIEAHSKASEEHGIPSGLVDLDRKLGGGPQPGDFIIVAGRPSMGKSVLGVQWARQAARLGHAAFFSLEMPKEQVINRLVSAERAVALSRLRQPRLLDQIDFQAITEARSQLPTSNITIDDRGGLTLAQLRARARRIAAKGDLKMIVLDYFQLMQGMGDNRREGLEEISRGVKQLAKDLGVVIAAMAQLNRVVEARDNKRPHLSDLREAGGLEQDADTVIALYRDEYYNAESKDKGIAEAIILKQRNGPTGTVELAWLPERGLFGNYAGPDARERHGTIQKAAPKNGIKRYAKSHAEPAKPHSEPRDSEPPNVELPPLDDRDL